MRIGDNDLSFELLPRILKLNIEIRKKIMNESQILDNKVSKILTSLLEYELGLILSDN